jgi:5-methylcytosine-specific restriction endonuclease McrA
VRDAYKREHPLCEDHLERGEIVPMQLVDHKIPLPYGPRLEKTNLRSLCDPCHRVKTDKDRAAGYQANVVPKQEEQRGWVIA